MRYVWVTLVAFFLQAATMHAQSHVQRGGAPAAGIPPPHFTGFAVSFGYSYVDLTSNALTPLTMQGGEAAFTADLSPHFELKADISYERNRNLYGYGVAGSTGALLAGPVFYPLHLRGARVYGQTLLGIGRVVGVIPLAFVDGPIYRFNVTEPAYVLGGGVEYALSRSFALRGGADYVHTRYYDASSHTRHGDLRVTTSFVYRFGGGRWNRR